MEVLDLARACHQANRNYCIDIGDYSIPTWDEAPAWQKNSIEDGVKFILENPDSDLEDQHENWLGQRMDWTHGKVKNIESKVHPCICLYDELPDEQKHKVKLFRAVVNKLSPLVYERTGSITTLVGTDYTIVGGVVSFNIFSSAEGGDNSKAINTNSKTLEEAKDQIADWLTPGRYGNAI